MLGSYPGERAEELRQMYLGNRANPTARFLAKVWAKVFAFGLQPPRWVTLEVTGRRSGKPTRFPLGMADLDGEWYLVSMLGNDCNWVRNVRAAQGHARLERRGVRNVVLVEVPVDQRAPILKRYLQQVPGGRPHIRVDPDAPLADFEAIAADYPAFRVTDAAS